jgi:hypothetical protein
MDVAFFLGGLLSSLLAAFFFLAGWGYGRILNRWFHFSGPDHNLVAIALGTGALGYIAFGLGLVGLLRPIVLAGVMLLGLILAYASRREVDGEPRRSLKRAQQLIVRGGLPVWYAVVAGLAAAFAFLGALLPETEYDALWYHLAFPARYIRSGWLLDLPCERMSPTPQHVELLYTYALLFVDVGSLPDGRAAKFIHFGFGVFAALWTGLLAVRLVGRRWMMPAVALLLAAPTFLWEMTTAYNELPLTFLGIGSLALLITWRAGQEGRLLALAGVLMGLALAGKHLAYLLLVPLCVLVFLTASPATNRSVFKRSRDVFLFTGMALAVALPWYLRAWYYTGNPLFPMFYDLFAGLGVPLERWDANHQRAWVSAMAEYGHGRTARDLILLPMRMLIYPRAYAGSLGPIWLMLLPILPLFWRRLSSNLRWLAFIALVYCAIWVSPYSSFQVRYLVPILPVLSILVVASMHRVEVVARRAEWSMVKPVIGALTITVLFFNLPAFKPVVQREAAGISSTFPVTSSTAMGLVHPDRHMRWRVDAPALRFINSHLPSDAVVVKYGWPVHFYSRPEVLFDWSHCVSGATWGAGAGEEERAYRHLREAGVTHILWDRRVDQETRSLLATGTQTFRERYADIIYSDGATEILRLFGRPRWD